jgi:hypothetical protein
MAAITSQIAVVLQKNLFGTMTIKYVSNVLQKLLIITKILVVAQNVLRLPNGVKPKSNASKIVQTTQY